jgi:vanillate O-demethylase ferredoxin subunit
MEAGSGSAPDDTFRVELARSKRAFTVKRSDTILGTLRDAGVDLAYSCEEGICGACEVKFLEGTPEHRDFVRSPEEHDQRGTVIICQAGCRSARLVLDI